MKKLGCICLALCCLLSFAALFPTTASAEDADKSVTLGSHSLEAAVPVLGTQQLVKNARSIILYEMNTQTLLYAWNADEQLYPASFVKIITALIAIEQGTLTDTVTVRQDVLDTVPYDAVSADLQADEVLTLEQLLYCMLVDSANDAAAVIADHISGSQAAFVAEMNQYAQELGCTGTQFMNVHGLHNEQQHTTARDTARILEAALQNEQFRQIFSAVDYTVDATNKSEARYISTGNYLMNNADVQRYYDARVTGGRTGITNDGDYCIAATAQINGLEVMSIVMGAKSEYERDGVMVSSSGGFSETSDLLDMVSDGYKAVQVLYDGQVLKQQSVSGGDCDVVLGSNASASTVLPADVSTEQLTFQYTEVSGAQAPIAKGQRVSTLEIWYQDRCVVQTDLYAMNAVSTQQTQSIVNAAPADTSGIWTSVLIAVAVIVGVLLLAVIGLRLSAMLRRAAMKKRSRRYRRDRRRSR